MTIVVTSSGGACGARVTGLDLALPMDVEVASRLRAAWLEHHVLCFPDQMIDEDDLERFTLTFGPFGHDPYIAPIPGRDHIIAVKRNADETSPIFAEAWHSDWSFQATPPAGTVLHALVVPPHGGETLFANQHMALEEMASSLRTRLNGITAVHSARRGYARTGFYGEQDKGRSMSIVASDDAEAVQRHPFVRRHPETGREGLFGCAGYIVGLEGADDGDALLAEVYAWQTQDRFVHSQEWKEGMVVMWDNRSVLHRATGGYEGHARLLHRTTIGQRP
jgi:taurine dioxygenase